MGNGDSSFTPTAGTAPRRSRGAEPASARSWWRTKGRSHAHRHASSCAFESLRGRGHQEEGGACNQGVESYWCDSPWGAGDNVFLDTGSFSAHFSAAHTSSSPPADGAASHASCSSSARTEDSGLGDSLILRTEGAEQLEGAWSSLHHAHTSTTSGGSSSAPCGSGRKDFLKIRIRQLGDWTGSLSRKKRRVQVRQRRHPVDTAGSHEMPLIVESAAFRSFPLIGANTSLLSVSRVQVIDASL